VGDGTMTLGPAAAETFASLGLAFECLDATEHAPHLAGALAGALAETLVGRGWIRREDDSRVVHLTPSGARGLRARPGVGR
jgi:hypothetical protein